LEIEGGVIYIVLRLSLLLLLPGEHCPRTTDPAPTARLSLRRPQQFLRQTLFLSTVKLADFSAQLLATPGPGFP
jgi:hypothetical protein